MQFWFIVISMIFTDFIRFCKRSRNTINRQKDSVTSTVLATDRQTEKTALIIDYWNVICQKVLRHGYYRLRYKPSFKNGGCEGSTRPLEAFSPLGSYTRVVASRSLSFLDDFFFHFLQCLIYYTAYYRIWFMATSALCFVSYPPVSCDVCIVDLYRELRSLWFRAVTTVYITMLFTI